MKITKLMIPIMAIAMATLAACTGCTTNPTKTAAQATPDNKAETIAFALYGQFVLVEELVADLVETPGFPQQAKTALQTADRLASPAAESLKDGADTINEIRAVIAAGQECGPPKPDGKKLCAADLPAKLLALNVLMTDAAPKLLKLSDAYRIAPKPKKVTP